MENENLVLNKDVLQNEKSQQGNDHSESIVQNELLNENTIDTNSYIKKKFLNFQYQPLVDEIYHHLDEKHQEELKLEYEQITERNNQNVGTVKSRIINFYFLYKKTLYFFNNFISFIGYQLGWAFISANVLWLVHGIVLRGTLLSFYQSIIQFGNGMFDSLAQSFYSSDLGFFAAPEGFAFSIDNIVENIESIPNFIYQLAHEIIVYVCTLTIILFILRIIIFFVKNYRTKDKDANHLFEYNDKRSFFMLQSDKDDSIDYVICNFHKRYRRFIGSDFQRRKYITSYVNVYQSGLLNTKEGSHLTTKQYHKVIRSTILECIEHIIAWISYSFSHLIIVLGIYCAYASHITEPEVINQAFIEQSWWNSIAPHMISLSKIFRFIPGYENQYEFQMVFWGLFVFIILLIMTCSVYKRVIRPTIRHYIRYINFYLKVNDEIYQSDEKFKSVSVFKFWMVLAIFIYIPFIAFVIYNIEALHF